MPATMSCTAVRRPVGRGQREVGQAAPEHEPQPRATVAPTARAATNGAVPRGRDPVGRPQQHGQQRVDDDRAGRTVHRAGRAAQHPAEALAEPPHAERPRDRSGQRQPDRRPPGDSQADQQLDGGEDRVHQHQVALDQGRVPVDRAGDDTGVTSRRLPDHLRERLGEHGRLVLQHAVEQPDRGQGTAAGRAALPGTGASGAPASAAVVPGRPRPMAISPIPPLAACIGQGGPAGNTGKLAGIPQGRLGQLNKTVEGI